MNHSLTKGSIIRGLLWFAIPLFISNLFQQLYNTIDTVVIGYYLGDASLAAMGATAAIFELIVGFTSGVSTGFGIVLARFFGAKDRDGFKHTFSTSLILAFLIALGLTIISSLGMHPLLALLKTPADIFDQAYSYIHLISLSLLVTMAYNYMAALFRSLSDALTPLYVLFITSILNIILDIYFIVSLNLGVAGAAWATIVSQIVATILCIIFFIKKYSHYLPKREHFRFDKELCLDLLGQGISMGMMLSIVSIGTIILQASINALGTIVITAHTAARKITSLLSLPISTIAAAVSTFVSQNYGAKQKDRIIQGVRIANIASISYAIVLGLLAFIFSKTWVSLMSGSDTTSVLENGAMYLMINIPFFVVLGPLLILRNALQGLGKKMTPLISSVIELLGKVIFTIAFVPLFAYVGVCWCEPVIWVCMTIQLIYSYQKAKALI